MQVCLGRPSHGSMPLWTSVFFGGWASNGQDSPEACPRVIFNWKNFIEQLKLTLTWMLIETGEGPMCWVQYANMWQDCSLSAVQRKTTFVEQSRWPELSLFGPMPWCSFPCQKLLPKLAQKNCHTTVWIYPWKRSPTIADSILVSDQTDLFSFATHGDEYGKKSSPTETGKGGHWTPVFFCGCTSKGQDSPKASPRLFSNERTWQNNYILLLPGWLGDEVKLSRRQPVAIRHLVRHERWP